MNNAKQKLIFALDVDNLDDARGWVDMLQGQVGVFKVGKQLFTRCGMSGGPQGGEAGHRDGRRRQAAPGVGVVGRIAQKILASDISVERITHAVDYRRIGLQLHAPTKAIVKHRGNKRAFVSPAGFLLDYRSQGEYLVPGQSSVARLQGAVHSKRTIDQSGKNFLFSRGRPDQKVGIGKKIPFQAGELTKAQFGYEAGIAGEF